MSDYLLHHDFDQVLFIWLLHGLMHLLYSSGNYWYGFQVVLFKIVFRALEIAGSAQPQIYWPLMCVWLSFKIWCDLPVATHQTLIMLEFFHLNCIQIIPFTPLVCQFFWHRISRELSQSAVWVFFTSVVSIIADSHQSFWMILSILLPKYMFACMTGHWREPQILLPSHSIYRQVQPILLLTLSPCLVRWLIHVLLFVFFVFKRLNCSLSKFAWCKEHYASARTFDNLPWIASSLTLEK